MNELEIIHYRASANDAGQQIAVEHIGDYDRRCKFDLPHGSLEALLRDDEGRYYLRREVCKGDTVTSARHHPRELGYRCLVHRIGIKAAILWSIKQGVNDLYPEASDLLMGGRMVEFREEGSGEVWGRTRFEPDLLAGIKEYAAEAGLEFGASCMALVKRHLDKRAADKGREMPWPLLALLDPVARAAMWNHLRTQPEYELADVLNAAVTFMLTGGANAGECLYAAKARRLTFGDIGNTEQPVASAGTRFIPLYNIESSELKRMVEGGRIILPGVVAQPRGRVHEHEPEDVGLLAATEINGEGDEADDEEAHTQDGEEGKRLPDTTAAPGEPE